MNLKNNQKTRRSIRLAVVFVVVALIAGIYFLFKPFPAGPSLDVRAEAPQAGKSMVVNMREHIAAGRRTVAQSASPKTNRLYVGLGTFLATGQQSTEILAPVARPAETSGTDKLYIGLGYSLVTNSQGSRIIAPSAAASAPNSISEYPLNLGGGDVLKNESQGGQIIVPSAATSARASAPAEVQPFDIGGGYLLVPAAGGWVMIPGTVSSARSSTPSKVSPFDTEIGYILVPAAGGWVPVPVR